MIAFIERQTGCRVALNADYQGELPMIFLGEKLDAGDVLHFESLTGIPRHVLRPDLYADPDGATGYLHYASLKLAGGSSTGLFSA